MFSVAVLKCPLGPPLYAWTYCKCYSSKVKWGPQKCAASRTIILSITEEKEILPIKWVTKPGAASSKPRQSIITRQAWNGTICSHGWNGGIASLKRYWSKASFLNFERHPRSAPMLPRPVSIQCGQAFGFLWWAFVVYTIPFVYPCVPECLTEFIAHGLRVIPPMRVCFDCLICWASS